jgi:hypothetical protein
VTGNPLSGNPLLSREDLQRAVRDLVAPLERHASPGGAWIIPGRFAANYSDAGAGLEGFARRLWGLAPLAAGGGDFSGWARIREGLATGTDPRHAEYWGDPHDQDVRLVEMASLGTALALARPQLWDPLPQTAKDNVARYLAFANSRKMVVNNWLFFRVLANLGLEAVGLEPDRQATQEAIDGIEAMYLGDGWYADGHTRQRDYYIAFAMHYYALLYCKCAPNADPALVRRYRERARLFAADFIYWFSAEGAALPFGRSLTYRFAQASFWGALAFADEEALPWGVIKGLLLRNIRWWARQPVFTEDGVLSVGYGYPNIILAEQYNAPGSPYWALKSFLPLALPADHPFWCADEAPLPPLQTRRVMPHAGMVVCREAGDDPVVALATGQWQTSWPMRHAEQKYSKFAYSVSFGFCVDAGQSWADSMLVFSEDGHRWAGRRDSLDHHISPDGELYSKWLPMPDVEVETWLRPHGRWHMRIHRIRTLRRVQTIEAGFATNAGARDLIPGQDTHADDDRAVVHGGGGSSGILDLSSTRRAEISSIEPNINVLYPRTLAPLLKATIEPGTHVFMTAVLGTLTRETFDHEWRHPPSAPVPPV